MIDGKSFFDLLVRNEIDFFAGVPDSLLKHFCACISEQASPEKHIITANEGVGISLATGYYLATGKIGLVYMQNSGLGNSINPLVSLTAKEVYSIPILLMIGWRGEPGVKDEPQHMGQGRITLSLLKNLGIPYGILSGHTLNFEKCLTKAVKHFHAKKTPYAIVVKENSFKPCVSQEKHPFRYPLGREDAIRYVVSLLNADDIVVATTGKISRELFETRKQLGRGHEKDFLTVGSMGHASSIALGIALSRPSRNVYCFDGDGSFIMHMGALSTISQTKVFNFRHIIFNNYSHDSVGGQPTAAAAISIPGIATASGYVYAGSAQTKAAIRRHMNRMQNSKGPALLEVRVNKGARENLGRPTRTPAENRDDFMKFLR